MSIFGTVTTGAQIENAVLNTTKKWLGTYIPEMERQAGLPVPTVARPRFYSVVTAIDLWPEDQVPAIFVLTHGTDGTPEFNGTTYDLWWSVEVACMVATSAEATTRAMAYMYTGAIRTLLLQHPSLGGVADAVEWVGESFEGRTGSARDRTMGLGRVELRVHVSNAVSRDEGPTVPLFPEPDPDPDNPTEVVYPPEWWTVNNIIVDVDVEPVNEELGNE